MVGKKEGVGILMGKQRGLCVHLSVDINILIFTMKTKSLQMRGESLEGKG